MLKLYMLIINEIISKHLLFIKTLEGRELTLHRHFITYLGSI